MPDNSQIHPHPMYRIGHKVKCGSVGNEYFLVCYTLCKTRPLVKEASIPIHFLRSLKIKPLRSLKITDACDAESPVKCFYC